MTSPVAMLHEEGADAAQGSPEDAGRVDHNVPECAARPAIDSIAARQHGRGFSFCAPIALAGHDGLLDARLPVPPRQASAALLGA